MEMLETLIFLMNFAATWFLVGLIWFLQVVHYPLFKVASERDFTSYEKAHTPLSIQIIFPAMVVELVSATLLVVIRPKPMTPGEALFGLLLVAGVWVVTTFLIVPAQQKLVQQFDENGLNRLLVFNWVRTFAWSLRGLLLFFACYRIVLYTPSYMP